MTADIGAWWEAVHHEHTTYPRWGRCSRRGCSSPVRWHGEDRPCSYACTYPARELTTDLLAELRERYSA